MMNEFRGHGTEKSMSPEFFGNDKKGRTAMRPYINAYMRQKEILRLRLRMTSVRAR